MSFWAMPMFLAGAPAPITPSISFIGTATGTTSASQTINSVSIGAADSHRLVIVGVFGWYNGDISPGLTAVTINGVSAAFLPANQTTSGQTGMAGLAYLPLSAGTTANIGLTFSSASTDNVEIAVWRALVNSYTPVDTDSVSAATNTHSITLSGGDVGVFLSSGGGSQALSSSVNITQDARLIPARLRPSYVGRINAPGSLFSLTMNNSNLHTTIGASWS